MIACRSIQTHHTDFSLLAGTRGADQGLQLISDALVIVQDLSQLLHKVLSLAWIWQVPYSYAQRGKRR